MVLQGAQGTPDAHAPQRRSSPDRASRLAQEAGGKSEVGRIMLQIEAPGNRLSIWSRTTAGGSTGGEWARCCPVAACSPSPRASTAPPTALALIFQPAFFSTSWWSRTPRPWEWDSPSLRDVPRDYGIHLRNRPAPAPSILTTFPLSISRLGCSWSSCRRQTFRDPPARYPSNCFASRSPRSNDGEGILRSSSRATAVPLLTLASLIGMSDPDSMSRGKCPPGVVL